MFFELEIAPHFKFLLMTWRRKREKKKKERKKERERERDRQTELIFKIKISAYFSFLLRLNSIGKNILS